MLDSIPIASAWAFFDLVENKFDILMFEFCFNEDHKEKENASGK